MIHSKSVLRGYISLAAAIVNTGIMDNDIRFLESEWCSTLIDTVISYNNIDDSVRFNKLNAQTRLNLNS